MDQPVPRTPWPRATECVKPPGIRRSLAGASEPIFLAAQPFWKRQDEGLQTRFPPRQVLNERHSDGVNQVLIAFTDAVTSCTVASAARTV